MRIIVTGGAGFIGSALCRFLIKSTDDTILNIDNLTYAGNLDSLRELSDSPRYRFVRADICDRSGLDAIFTDFEPDGVCHLAAETHVDRSITGASAFVETNVVGTINLLEAARGYLAGADAEKRSRFRLVHVSTDEVYGSLGPSGVFTETTTYDPSSPYAASKAAADHLVRAWHVTYGLPAIITNCSNNYGPYQFPEKLIPLMILNAIDGKPLPVYGDGLNVRDWLHVEDHARALSEILRRGRPGEKYNVGANSELTNLDVVNRICARLDQLRPAKAPHQRLIGFVQDRPGHDRRYAIDASKLRAALGWRHQVQFADGIDATVDWYLANEWWWRPLRERYAGERLGLLDLKAP